MAKEAGLMISADDVKNAQSKMSEAHLESLAGGTVMTATPGAVVGGWIPSVNGNLFVAKTDHCSYR